MTITGPDAWAGYVEAESADQARYAAHDAIVLPGQKKLGFGIDVERMFLAVQKFLDRDPQRRHPMRIVAVERKRQLDELFQCAFVVDGYDLKSAQ